MGIEALAANAYESDVQAVVRTEDGRGRRFMGDGFAPRTGHCRSISCQHCGGPERALLDEFAPGCAIGGSFFTGHDWGWFDRDVISMRLS